MNENNNTEKLRQISSLTAIGFVIGAIVFIIGLVINAISGGLSGVHSTLMTLGGFLFVVCIAIWGYVHNKLKAILPPKEKKEPVVRITPKEREEKTEKLLQEMRFTVTSSYKLTSGVNLLTKTWYTKMKMYVDTTTKRIAFADFTSDDDITLLDFDKIISCEIIEGGQTSKSSSNGMMGAYGFAIGSTTTKEFVSDLRLKFTIRDIDKPTLNINLIIPGVKERTDGQIYKFAITFAEEVKGVIDNIISIRN